MYHPKIQKLIGYILFLEELTVWQREADLDKLNACGNFHNS